MVLMVVSAKKLLVVLIVFSLFFSATYASSFDASSEPIKDKIIVDEIAKFKINVKNNFNNKDEYRIYTLDFPTWDVRTEPIVNPITLELEVGQEGSVEVLVDPLKIKDVGAYQVNVNVRSKTTNDVVSVPLKVTVLSTEPLLQGYVPTVITNVGIPEKIDPRKSIPLTIVLNNQNIIDYNELVVELESNLIKETIHTTLAPKEEKKIELTKQIEPLTKPQEDKLVVAVFAQNRSIINPIVRKIEVIEYTDKRLVEEEKKFMVTERTYRFVSNNNDYEGVLKVETTFLDSFFSATNPKAKIIKEDGKRYIVWEVRLENNQMQAVVTTNFIPILISIILIIVVIAAYYTLRSPLVIIKEANNIVKEEGGISEMTVALHVTNRAKSKMSEIEVSDNIPGLVFIGSDVPIGSLQPTKVLKHEKKGTTIAKWTIDSLDPLEERVLSYRVKSRLSILGNFSLPPAKATFKINNKLLTTSSNRLIINE